MVYNFKIFTSVSVFCVRGVGTMVMVAVLISFLAVFLGVFESVELSSVPEASVGVAREENILAPIDSTTFTALKGKNVFS